MPPTTAAPPAPTAARAQWTRTWTPRLVAFGEFIDGYDLLVMGAALLFLKPDFGLTADQTGRLGAIAFLGTAVGLVVFGDLSDRLGRKVIFVVNLALFVAVSLASAFVTEVWQLMAARFLIGVAVGMDIPTSHAFLAEIAPTARRGRIAGSLPNLMWLGGAITSVLVALALKPVAGDDTWRWLFGLAAPPAPAGRPSRSWRALFTRRAGARLAAVTAFFALQAFGGAVATIAGPLVMESTGIGTEHALLFSLGGFTAGFLAVAAGARIIDRVNRRALGIATCLGVFLAGLVLALAGRTGTPVLLTAYLCYALLTWLGPGVLSWVWSSELFPTELRGLGSGIAQCVTRLMIALNILLVPHLLDRFGLRAVALYATAYALCAAVVAAAPFLATTGRSLEELDATAQREER
ncbi:MFS transporter [Streptomyces luteireticuli]|uniref:MFS transporter n=1 Tax=Streptomyces luteireticuli TaxID=173858 RepID=UPI003557AAD7